MLSASGVPLFSGIEDTDDLLIMTMEEREKELQDEISIYHPVYQYLKKKNMIEYRDSIGAYVPVKLMDKENKTVQWVTGYDDAINTPSQVASEARFAYAHLTGVQMYNREEVTKNSGPEGIVDLVDSLEEQLQTSLNNEFGDAIMGTQDADGRKIMGLGRIMTVDASCGGIDPTTQGYSYWNPTVTYKTGSTKFALATEFLNGLRKGMRDGTKAANGVSPDVWIAGEDVYDSLQAHYMDKLQITLSELMSGDWDDFEMFSVHGRTVIYEPSMNAKDVWMMNFKKDVKLRIHSGTNFTFTPWQMMEGKVQAKKRNNLTYAALYCKKRKSNVLLSFS